MSERVTQAMFATIDGYGREPNDRQVTLGFRTVDEASAFLSFISEVKHTWTALAARPASAEPVAWLLESLTQWSDGHHRWAVARPEFPRDFTWTTNATLATRYPDERAANEAMKHIAVGFTASMDVQDQSSFRLAMRPTEHVFLAGTPPTRSRTPDGCDAVQDDFDYAYALVLGSPPVWSSTFGRHDALEQMRGALSLLRTTPPAAAQDREDAVMKEFNRHFPEQSEHEEDCDPSDCRCNKDIQGIVQMHNASRRNFLARLPHVLNAARAAGATDGQ